MTASEFVGVLKVIVYSFLILAVLFLLEWLRWRTGFPMTTTDLAVLLVSIYMARSLYRDLHGKGRMWRRLQYYFNIRPLSPIQSAAYMLVLVLIVIAGSFVAMLCFSDPLLYISTNRWAFHGYTGGLVSLLMTGHGVLGITVLVSLRNARARGRRRRR